MTDGEVLDSYELAEAVVMPDGIVGSQAAQRVQALLGTRQGREYLYQYGWSEGLPIVVAYPLELIDDVMGLMSLQEQSGLVASCEAGSHAIHLLHVSRPSSALITVEAVGPRARISHLFDQAKTNNSVTFRSKYWRHSAIAHLIPPIIPASTPSFFRRELIAA